MVKQVEKSKTKGEVLTISVNAQASLGVRTRSQTLRLNHLKESSVVDTCYLQLRSRRVERLPPSVATKRQNATRKQKRETSHDQVDEKNEEEAPPSVKLGRNERTSTERVPANSFGAASRFTNVAKEFDDFFDGWEKRQVEKFTKKYNYDFANDKPLSGSCEWEEIKR